MSPVFLFFLQSVILIAVPVAIWNIRAVRHSIPLVVIQIMFGVALGPTFLGRIAPGVSAVLLPSSSFDKLSGASWLGAAFFSFLTGLHLDLGELAGKSRAFLITAASSMIVPLVLGLGVGVWASGIPDFLGPSAKPGSFVLAIGLATSATALPVLGAILRETGLIQQKLGRAALGYAAVNDVLLWFAMIALLTIVDASNHSIGGFAASLLLSILYFCFMAFGVRPLLEWLFAAAPADRSNLGNNYTVLVASILLASGLATEALGLHYLIGAFTAGAVMPKSAKESIRAVLESLTVLVLLPFYFVVTGLKVAVDFGSGPALFFFAISTLAAMFGKILGTAVPARVCGYGWNDALRLGALMQCKGFVELIILNVLLDVGLVSRAAFSSLILMSIVTTALTTPMVQALAVPAAKRQSHAEAASRTAAE